MSVASYTAQLETDSGYSKLNRTWAYQKHVLENEKESNDTHYQSRDNEEVDGWLDYGQTNSASKVWGKSEKCSQVSKEQIT